MNNTRAAGATRDADTEIAHKITNALIVRGIDKKSLAEKIGVSYTTLRRRLEQERGDRQSFTVQQLGTIAEVLEIETAALLPAWMLEQAAA